MTLNISTNQSKLWPLQLSRPVLSVFARVALHQLTNKDDEQSEVYAAIAWKMFLQSLVKSACESNKICKYFSCLM